MNLFKQFLGNNGSALGPAEAQARLNGKHPPLLLDVRQPEEYRDGHISGALLIPLNELSQRMSELPDNREILCVCRSGARSGTATRQLAAQGFTATNLSGGMIAWQRAGLPIKKGMAK